jgi:ankyrin repeat/SOCS box protein 13/metal transporter CNNM
LLSLDVLDLQILENSGTETEKHRAKKIRPLVERHHLLLVTLLICNAGAAEARPIFLDRVVGSPAIAIIVSVTAVLVFGEIIPQALCTSYGLAIGSFFSYFVWFLIVVTFVISWPISKVLDFLLGKHHSSLYRRAELKELVQIHSAKAEGGEQLTLDEVSIIRGALDLREKTVGTCMTPIDKVFMLSINDRLDLPTMQRILEHGISRIPIYYSTQQENNPKLPNINIMGMILVKSLILYDPKDATPISSLPIRRLPVVNGRMPLYDMLNQFQTGRSHMAVVVDAEDHLSVLGIITLEDVIEELIQEEISDETDVDAAEVAAKKVFKIFKYFFFNVKIKKTKQNKTKISNLLYFFKIPCFKIRASSLISKASSGFTSSNLMYRSLRGIGSQLGSFGLTSRSNANNNNNNNLNPNSPHPSLIGYTSGNTQPVRRPPTINETDTEKTPLLQNIGSINN